MAQTMRGCLTACSQTEGAAEPENSLSIMQLEEQVDAEEGEVIVNYEPDVDYDPEGQTLTLSQSLKKKRKKTLMQSM